MLTKGAARVIRRMHEAEKREAWEDAEIVCDRLDCWLGDTRVHRRTIRQLVDHVAISLVSEPGSATRYALNGTGRAIDEEPEVADRVADCLRRRVNCDQRGYPIDGNGNRIPTGTGA